MRDAVGSANGRPGPDELRSLVELEELEPTVDPSGWFSVQLRYAYLVGEAQAFDIEADTLYNTCFDDCIFETLMKGRTAQERRQVLRDNKISHVFVHWLEIARYRSPGNYGFTDYVTPQLVHGELIAQQGLLRVDPDAPQNPPVYEVFEVVDASTD